MVNRIICVSSEEIRNKIDDLRQEKGTYIVEIDGGKCLYLTN